VKGKKKDSYMPHAVVALKASAEMNLADRFAYLSVKFLE
jgi:hypothetical protein